MSGNINSIRYTENYNTTIPERKTNIETGSQNISSVQVFGATLPKPNTTDLHESETSPDTQTVQTRNLDISGLSKKYEDNPIEVIKELGIEFNEKQVAELQNIIKDKKHLQAFLTIADKATLNSDDIMAAVKKSKEFKNSNVFKRGWNVLKTVFTDGFSEAKKLAKSERVYYSERLSTNMSVIRKERQDFSSEGLANIADVCVQKPEITEETMHFVMKKSEPSKHAYTENDVMSAAEFMSEKPNEAETFLANAQELESIRDENGRMKYKGSTIIRVDKRMVCNKELQPTMMKTAHKSDMTDEYLDNITYNLERNPEMQRALEYSLDAKKADGTDRFSACSINSESNHLVNKNSNYCASYTQNLQELAPYENITPESIVKIAGNITSHPETKNDIIAQIKSNNMSEAQIVEYSNNLAKTSSINEPQTAEHTAQTAAYNTTENIAKTQVSENSNTASPLQEVQRAENNNFENFINNRLYFKSSITNPIENEDNRVNPNEFDYLEVVKSGNISESDYQRIYNYFGTMTDALIAKIKKDPGFIEVIKACNGDKVIIEAELNNPGLVAKIRSAGNPSNKQLRDILSVCTDTTSTNVMLAALETCSVNQAIKATRNSKITNTKQDALEILASTKSNTNKQNELEQLYGVGSNRQFVC